MSVKITSGRGLKCFPFSDNVVRAAEIAVLVPCPGIQVLEINGITSLN